MSCIREQPDPHVNQFLATFPQNSGCYIDPSPPGYTFAQKFVHDVRSLHGCFAASEILVYSDTVFQCVAIQTQPESSPKVSVDFEFQFIKRVSDLQRPNWLDLQSLAAPAATSSRKRKIYWILSMISPTKHASRRQLKWITRTVSAPMDGVLVYNLEPCDGHTFSRHHRIESALDLEENGPALPYLLQVYRKEIEDAKDQSMKSFIRYLVSFAGAISDQEGREAYLCSYESYCNRLAEVEEEACSSIGVYEFDGRKYSEMTQEAKEATCKLFRSLKENTSYPRDPDTLEMAYASFYGVIMSWWTRGSYSLNDLHDVHEIFFCLKIATARALLEEQVRRWKYPLILPGWIPQNIAHQLSNP